MATNDLFSGDENTNNLTPPEVEDKDYLAELVGEGKKFKDERELAKGKALSDAFIEQLKRENAGLREELGKTKPIEEHLNDLREAIINRGKQEGNIREMTPDHNSDGHETPQNPPQTKTPSADDIAAMVASEVNRIVSVEKQKSNIDDVISAAKRVYGDNYKKELSNKAQELGSSPDELFKIAENNPKLFKSIMGLNGQPQNNQGTSNRIFETTNTEALRTQSNNSGHKKYSDYEQLRKEDPQRYFSPEVQNEMYKLAEQIGPSFFDS